MGIQSREFSALKALQILVVSLQAMSKNNSLTRKLFPPHYYAYSTVNRPLEQLNLGNKLHL